MNKTHFSDFVELFEVQKIITVGKHSSRLYPKTFVSKDRNLLSYSYSQMVLGYLEGKQLNLWAKKGRTRGILGHLWPSHLSCYWWNLNKVNARCLLPNVTWGLSGPHTGAEQEVWFCFFAAQSWEAGGYSSGRALKHHCSYHQCFHRRDLGFFQPGVKRKCMVPVLQLEKRPSAVKQKA